MSTRVVAPGVKRGRIPPRAAAAPGCGPTYAIAVYPPEFSRWLMRAQVTDFLEFLRVLCGAGTTPVLPGMSREAIRPAGRWVQRDGCTVRFTNGAVPGRSRIHEHRLPDSRIAGRFATALLRTCVEGHAAPLDPEEWAAWQHAGDRRETVPVALPVAASRAGRRDR